MLLPLVIFATFLEIYIPLGRNGKGAHVVALMVHYASNNM